MDENLSDVIRDIARAGAKRDPEPTFQCDCCGQMVPEADMLKAVVYGIETSACIKCYRGELPEAYKIEELPHNNCHALFAPLVCMFRGHQWGGPIARGPKGDYCLRCGQWEYDR